MERTGWREEAYSFLSRGGVRWWKGGREVRRVRAAKEVRRVREADERARRSGVVGRGGDGEWIARQGSWGSVGSVESYCVSGSDGAAMGARRAENAGGELVLVDGYGERYAVLEIGKGGGRFEVLKEGVEGEGLDEIVVSGVAWAVRKGLGGRGWAGSRAG